MSIRSIVSVVALLGSTASVARADGGAVRWSGVSGPYRVAVLTSPEPLRVGPVDVSVVVCDARSGEEIPDARIAIAIGEPGGAGDVTRQIASRDLSPSRLYEMASFELGSAGRTRMEIEIDAPLGSTRIATELTVSPALPRWVDFAGWILLPLLPITLFTAREVRRERRAAHTSR